jgi:single-strand DNA-binding protein
MAMNNTITIVGNVTREPEIRFTSSGRSQLNLGVAVNHRWGGRDGGEQQEETSFFNVVCWGDMAEHVSTSVSKGMRIIVMGRMRQRTWETENGEKRNMFEIIADEVGPSLRWATVEVTRAERRTPANGGTGAPQQGSAAPVGGGGGGYDDFGEEPF